MKYIRTKYDIYLKDGELNEPFEIIFGIKHENDYGKAIAKEGIIAEADTIEELCDAFVVAYEDGAKIVYGDLEWAKTKAKSSLEFGNKSIIYGAIWTDKGLIYVAKMNEKGEQI